MAGKESYWPWLISILLNVFLFALGGYYLHLPSKATALPHTTVQVDLVNFSPPLPQETKQFHLDKTGEKKIAKTQSASWQQPYSKEREKSTKTQVVEPGSTKEANQQENLTADRGKESLDGPPVPAREEPSEENKGAEPKQSSEIATVGEQGVVSPDYIYTTKPSYPLEARKEGLEGKVILKVLVEKNGQTRKVELAKSSGHSVLDQEALRAVEKWRFRPAKRDGEIIACWVFIPLSFKMEGR